MSEWHQISTQEAINRLETSVEHGLPDAEVTARFERDGPNELVERGGRGPWRILGEQFTETMVVILIIAAVISAILGDLKDAVAIVAIVFLNALLGFRQEYQAEQAMAALKKLAVPVVRTRRNGHVQEVSARTLVPGDVILLEAGNLVPADSRLVESANLRVQEAALTGESEPVNKDEKSIARPDAPLAERHNMLYMGTVVTYGRGVAVVTQTGMKTELGGIAELMQTAGQEPTPLQRRLDKLGKGLALAALGLVAIVFLLGWLQGEEIRILFLTAISIAVAAVPEGLPAVVTIALALGARRMLKRKALIRKLPAVEALGSVTTICSDKTGTLTENRMTVTVVDMANHRLDLFEEEHGTGFGRMAMLCTRGEPSPQQVEALQQYPTLVLLLAGGALCNDALIECEEDTPEDFVIVGDPTEGALVVAAARMGLAKETLEHAFPRTGELPFDSDRKRMTTLHDIPESLSAMPPTYQQLWNWSKYLGDVDYLSFTKGSVDGLLEISTGVWNDGQVEEMTPEWRSRIEQANADLAASGMRVLGIACRPFETKPPAEMELEADLIFVGLTGMIDPARPEVKDAVQTCRTAGIRPVMITGDHPLTARHIAEELGIAVNGAVTTGQDLERLSVPELEQVVTRESVYARVSPEHKLRIVEALQRQGQVVAMTGDGVNDAPALRTADIGVAMGITGTDVSKEASDMVLLDDNFATIVAAVEEGRVIYDNIRKFIKYTLTSNAGEIWVMLLSPLLGMPLALLPLQILWINLVTDGLPGLALSVERPEPNTMHRPPYPLKENVFARGLGRDILIIGFLMGILPLAIGYYYWRMDSPYWQTMVFTGLTLSEMGYVMSIRSNRESLFRIGPFTNKALIGAVVFTTLLQIAAVYVPFFQNLLEIQALPLRELLICFSLAIVLFIVVEIEKWLIRRRDQ